MEKCCVLMPFCLEFKNQWELAFVPVIKGLGMQSYRGDSWRETQQKLTPTPLTPFTSTFAPGVDCHSGLGFSPESGPGTDSPVRDLDSQIASRISSVVALVLTTGTSKGEALSFLKRTEKESPPLRRISTSSFRAVSSNSERRCRAWEYVYTFMSVTLRGEGCRSLQQPIGAVDPE